MESLRPSAAKVARGACVVAAIAAVGILLGHLEAQRECASDHGWFCGLGGAIIALGFGFVAVAACIIALVAGIGGRVRGLPPARTSWTPESIAWLVGAALWTVLSLGFLFGSAIGIGRIFDLFVLTAGISPGIALVLSIRDGSMASRVLRAVAGAVVVVFAVAPFVVSSFDPYPERGTSIFQALPSVALAEGLLVLAIARRRDWQTVVAATAWSLLLVAQSVYVSRTIFVGWLDPVNWAEIALAAWLALSARSPRPGIPSGPSTSVADMPTAPHAPASAAPPQDPKPTQPSQGP